MAARWYHRQTKAKAILGSRDSFLTDSRAGHHGEIILEVGYLSHRLQSLGTSVVGSFRGILYRACSSIGSGDLGFVRLRESSVEH